jgi:hypothetical protein
MKHLRNFFFLVAAFHCSVALGQPALQHKMEKKTIEVENGFVKIRLVKTNSGIRQEYFARSGASWHLVVNSLSRPSVFPDSGVQLYNARVDSSHRFLVAETMREMTIVVKNGKEVVVKLTGASGKTQLAQFIGLQRGQRFCHITAEADLVGSPAKLDYLLSAFTFNSPGAPQFVHTPGLKFDNEDSRQNRFKLLPGKDQVIGDRAFHSPAIILQEKKIFAALVPDLDAINRYAVVSPDARRSIDIARNKFSVPIIEEKYTMPTGLDLNVKNGITPQPVFSFGFMDNIIAHHIRYQRTNDQTMIRTLASNKLRYEFDLFLQADLVAYNGYQQVIRHLWEKYGHRVFSDRPHLAMPFEQYFGIVDSITFHPSRYPDIDIPLKGYEDHGSWLEFELNGMPVGGYRSAINWWNDVLHNSTFWNNARDASGFWFWGKHMNRADLQDKAKRIINFCLAAPRNEHGLFATLYNANDKTWGLQFSDPPHGKNQFFLRQSHSYDVPSMSKTGAHLVDYYLRCERDERIIQYLRPYADWLLTAIDEQGSVPSYVTEKMEQSTLMRYTAHPAASMWFLAAMFNATKENRYRQGAIKIAAYLENEIIPGAKWIDMEQYYSCGAKPIGFLKDVWQNQFARGNLAIIWASEGFAHLYNATNTSKYLKLGEACVDYLSFSQCSWDPHFIYTAFPFGGFTADNSDNATYLDARQAETVKPFIWYGKVLGRQDLVERGVAAARSSVVLMNLPSHKENGIYSHTNIYPFGLGPENIDHEGHPQSAMRTCASWGEGSGIFTGLAEAYRELGGAYIDFKKGTMVGVNGVIITKANQKPGQISINIQSSFLKLKTPWAQPFEIFVTTDGISAGSYDVYLNDKRAGKVDLITKRGFNLLVYPDGSFRLE